MKFFILLFSIALFFNTPIQATVEEKSGLQEPNTYILSYRRSGTHMLTYFIGFLTKRPVSDGRFDLFTGADPSRSRIFQVHNLSQVGEWYGMSINPENDNLILIIRNYKECMMREFLDDYDKVIKHLQNPYEDILSLRYFENLQRFDEWNPQNRLLVYYEDLITNSEYEIIRLLEFLKSPKDHLNDFIQNIDFHFNFPREYYANTHGGSFSNGTNLDYHTLLLPPGIEEKMDEITFNKHSFLAQKYLQRYHKNYVVEGAHDF